MGKNVEQGTLFPELEPVQQPQEEVSKKKARKSVKKTVVEVPDNSDEIAKLKQEIQTLQKEKEALQKENETLKEKAEAFDELISSNSLFTTTVVAKSFGKSAIWLNKYLEGKRVQYLHGDTWVLYAQYQNRGYTKICWYENHKQTGAQRAHTYWTAKGIIFIRELLKKDGII